MQECKTLPLFGIWLFDFHFEHLSSTLREKRGSSEDDFPTRILGIGIAGLGLGRCEDGKCRVELSLELESFIGGKDIPPHPFFFIIEPLFPPLQIAYPTHCAEEFISSRRKKLPMVCWFQEQSPKGIRLETPASLRHSMNMGTFLSFWRLSHLNWSFGWSRPWLWKEAPPWKVRSRRKHLSSSDFMFSGTTTSGSRGKNGMDKQ